MDHDTKLKHLETLRPVVYRMALRKVKTITGQSRGLVDAEDLGQCAMIRIWTELDKYDESQTALKTWAGLRIMGAFGDFLRGCWTLSGTGRTEARNRYYEETGQTPAGSFSISHSGRINRDDAVEKGELEIDSPTQRDWGLTDTFRELLRGCTQDERSIVLWYYIENMTMKEIGASLGLSESRVSQIHSKLIMRLQREHGSALSGYERQPISYNHQAVKVRAAKERHRLAAMATAVA